VRVVILPQHPRPYPSTLTPDPSPKGEGRKAPPHSQGRGEESATFLPQVWQQLPAPEQFLGHLCRKAGLAEGAWRSGTLEILIYQVQSFEESRSGGKEL